MEHVTKKAIESLVRILNLPRPDRFSQDWEFEVSDPTRVKEFLDAYQTKDLNDEERFALMLIILDSFNNALIADCAAEPDWELISQLLQSRKDLHNSTITYWADLEEPDLELCFAITPRIRQLLHS